MNRTLIRITLLAFVLGAVLAFSPAPSDASAQAIVTGPLTAEANEYVVLYTEGASLASARAAVKAAGGTIVRENTQVGVATVHASSANFMVAVTKQSALAGASRNAPVGYAPQEARSKRDKVEREGADQSASVGPSSVVSPQVVGEPLASLQWDMQMIGATAAGSYAIQPGDRRVLVGVMDTGIDGSHPDIAPNFNAALSRNFTTDIPLIDGACASDPDGSCDDPANVDEDGHGTHVASTIAAPINGIGIAGVAPNVTLVNIRAGQDSGYFFLQPTVDALTYAGDIGIDVVNMSFYIDPWQYNCTNNPADSPAEQLEQSTIITATNRALNYAHNRGVTLINSMGNDHMNFDNKQIDDSSPDFPPGAPNTPRIRNINNSCLDMPNQGNWVLSITAIGPSKAKADYSNYGYGETTVSAPGGYFRDFFGTPQYRVVENEVLAAYPQSVAEANGDLNPDGTPNTPFVVRDCLGNTCAYYQYLQGTSMASPHAVGVAALIVSHYGGTDKRHPGTIGFSPISVETFLRASAVDTPCPNPPTVDYTLVGRDPEFNATCVGTAAFNSFYGDGIVNALKAVTVRNR